MTSADAAPPPIGAGLRQAVAMLSIPDLGRHVETRVTLDGAVGAVLRHTVQVDSSLVAPGTAPSMGIPVFKMPETLDYRHVKLRATVGGSSTERIGMPPCTIRVASGIEDVSDEVVKTLSETVIVPFSTAEIRAYPLVSIDVPAPFPSEIPPSDKSRFRQRVGVTPIADCDLPRITPGARLQFEGAGAVDVLYVRLHLALDRKVQRSPAGFAGVPQSLEREVVSSWWRRLAEVASDRASALARLEAWLIGQDGEFLGRGANEIEELRGELVQLSLLATPPSIDEFAAAQERLDTLLERSTSFVVGFSLMKPVALKLDRPPADTEIERVWLAYSTLQSADGSRREYAAGSSASLLLTAIVSFSVLAVLGAAQDPGAIVDQNGDALITVLALLPPLLLTQVDRADSSAVYAARRAKRLFLLCGALPLLLPLLAALFLLSESHLIGWAMGVLLLSGVASMASLVALRMMTDRARLTRRARRLAEDQRLWPQEMAV